MVGVLNATVTGNVGTYAFTCSVTVVAADQPTAQADLDAIKAWFVAGGAAGLVVTGTYTPQASGLVA